MNDNNYFWKGFLFSFVGHLAVVVFLTTTFESTLDDFGKPIVYSVTLDRGKNVGGITQAPKEKKKEPIAPPKKVAAEPPVTVQEKSSKEQKEEPQPDAEVSLAEKETPQPTPAPTQKPKPKATPKPKPKPKATPKPKPQKKVPPKKKEPTLAEINKRLQDAVQRYSGPSTDAGGEGFGGVGGDSKSGFGGGQLRPPEFFQYQKTLEYYIKSGWRWHDTSSNLRARVCFAISQSGEISDVHLCGSSGNSLYDESIIRAVRKANPLPPPPAKVYDFFKSVRFIFSPQE
ncbi:MAG: cell envelope integrity protein TolA [Bdellovibrionales bacterium]|nr:cell envelope integrity protein TolA [Bdellovibrionales bacterium]